MAVGGTHSYGLGGLLLWAVLVENAHAQGPSEREKTMVWGVLGVTTEHLRCSVSACGQK